MDGTGATVLPGFIDSHVQANLDDLHQAAVFGITTGLDMRSAPSSWSRCAASARSDPTGPTCAALSRVSPIPAVTPTNSSLLQLVVATDDQAGGDERLGLDHGRRGGRRPPGPPQKGAHTLTIDAASWSPSPPWGRTPLSPLTPSCAGQRPFDRLGAGDLDTLAGLLQRLIDVDDQRG